MANYNSIAANRRLEVLVFLFLIVPSMLFSYVILQPLRIDFVYLAVSTIFRDLGILFLVLFFLWQNKEPFESAGLTLHKADDEAVLGAFLFFPVFFFAILVQQLFQRLGLPIPQNPISILNTPKDVLQLLLGLILMLVVAVTEEMIFRGYLIKRFKEITGNKVSALFLSTAIFAIGHGYEGVAGVSIVSVLGLIYGLIYFWRGSLTAPITMHFLQNSLGMLIKSQIY